MKNCDALVIGGSAGSLDVLLKILPQIDLLINFPIIIVLHRKPQSDNLLVDLLKSRTGLRVKEAEEKEKIIDSNIYIAPSDYHLLIEKDHTFSLDNSEKVNYSRPSLDVIFESAADTFKNKLVCLLLSGSNEDGVQGLKEVKLSGGRVVIQNPTSAVVPYMPAQAILKVEVDKILPIEEMADYINELSK